MMFFAICDHKSIDKIIETKIFNETEICDYPMAFYHKFFDGGVKVTWTVYHWNDEASKLCNTHFCSLTPFNKFVISCKIISKLSILELTHSSGFE